MRASNPTDAELVRLSLAGNREAFGQLYDRHSRLVRVVAAAVGPARSEDVVQEAFLRAYSNLPRLRTLDRFRYWLVGIARKVVQEARRRPNGETLSFVVADGRPGPVAEIDNADEASHLRSLVNRLPEEQRQAVQFFFLSGRHVDEVAALLCRSRSGTYALLSQAVATLARWMTAGIPPEEVKR
jgi:RNA polymerase sigma-70 factor, ECF subfamily